MDGKSIICSMVLSLAIRKPIRRNCLRDFTKKRFLHPSSIASQTAWRKSFALNGVQFWTLKWERY
jgi:hypothetical protein